MSKESESYRLKMLRRLKQIDSGSPPSEVLEAKEVVAKYREEQARAREAIPRLGSPLPEPNLCPQCWFLHGRRLPLTAIEHPTDRDNFDRMKCRICGYVEDRDARP